MLTILGVLLIVLQLFFHPGTVWAGTGRINVTPASKVGTIGSPVNINIKLLQSNDSAAQASSGEKAVLKVRDATEGQSCTTDPVPSDSQGLINGTCVSTTKGSMTIYAESQDRGDTSEDVSINFQEASEPKQAKTPQQMTPEQQQMLKQQMAQQQAAQQGQQTGATGAESLASQPGLAPDKEGANNAGQVAGASDANGLLASGTTPVDPNAPVDTATTNQPGDTSKNDLELINSLIYLTGGIILIIGGVYFIFLQATQHTRRQKNKQEAQATSSATPPTAAVPRPQEPAPPSETVPTSEPPPLQPPTTPETSAPIQQPTPPTPDTTTQPTS